MYTLKSHIYFTQCRRVLFTVQESKHSLQKQRYKTAGRLAVQGRLGSINRQMEQMLLEEKEEKKQNTMHKAN